MPGPKGLGTVDTPLPRVVVFDPNVKVRDACDRPTRRSGGLTLSFSPIDSTRQLHLINEGRGCVAHYDYEAKASGGGDYGRT
eukprot:6187400-Pleurochrysis_carterae.AAC.1